MMTLCDEIDYDPNRCDWGHNQTPEEYFHKFDSCLPLRGAVFDYNWAVEPNEFKCSGLETWTPLEEEFATLVGGRQLVLSIFVVFLMLNTLLASGRQLSRRLFDDTVKSESKDNKGYSLGCGVLLNTCVQASVLFILLSYELVVNHNNDDKYWPVSLIRIFVLVVLWLILGFMITWRFKQNNYEFNPAYFPCTFIQGLLVLVRVVVYPAYLVNSNLDSVLNICGTDETWNTCHTWEIIFLAVFALLGVVPSCSKKKVPYDRNTLWFLYIGLKTLFHICVLFSCAVLVLRGWCVNDAHGNCIQLTNLDDNVPNMFVLFGVFVGSNGLFSALDFLFFAIDYRADTLSKIRIRSILLDVFDTLLIICNIAVMVYVWLLSVEHKPNRVMVVYVLSTVVGVLTFFEQSLFSMNQKQDRALHASPNVEASSTPGKGRVSVVHAVESPYKQGLVANGETIQKPADEDGEDGSQGSTFSLSNYTIFLLILSLCRAVIVVSVTLYVLRQKYYARTGDTSNIMLSLVVSILVMAGFVDRFNSLQVY
jgi:hypothetical protein